LLLRCQALEPGFAGLLEAAGALDVYLTAGRYPDTGPEPTTTEVTQAMEQAEQVVAFVATHLSQGRLP
jgi:hypothetical protein